MTGNQPMRTDQGGNQSKGANYENPGGNSTGTMGTPSTPSTSAGMSEMMNNGGGPEPHQGSNPGAQSDPGPKEVGFYDQVNNHVLGDDGVQATVERPSPMRMGGIEGTQPNDGQRGGQNTSTSGAQTSAYSSPEEYGANAGGRGAMGSETRNPVGFASALGDDRQPSIRPEQPGGVGGANAAQGDYVYQSRAAQMLVDMREDAQVSGSRMDEPAEDAAPRVADRAGEVADAVKDKAGGFFTGAKERMEGFFNVDLDKDGSIGAPAKVAPIQGTTVTSGKGATAGMTYGPNATTSDTSAGMTQGPTATKPDTSAGMAQGPNATKPGTGQSASQDAQSAPMQDATTPTARKAGAQTAEPQMFETREDALCNHNGDPRAKNCGNETAKKTTSSPQSFDTREAKPRDRAGDGGMKAGGSASRTETKQRELVDA